MAKRKRKQEPRAKVDWLSRAIKLHITPDGTLTIGPLHVRRGGHCGDWRDIPIDLIIEGRTEDAAGVLVENRDEPINDAPDEVYSLPVFSVHTDAEARRMQVIFGKVQYEALPNGQTHYRVWGFDGDGPQEEALAKIWELAERMAKIYAEHVERRV